MNTKELKAFDLQAALAGKKVVTRDGMEVLGIFHLPQANERFRVAVVLPVSGNNVQSYSEAGRCDAKRDSNFDLFMAPEEKKAWVNLYNRDGNFSVWPSQEEADSVVDSTSDLRLGGKAHRITWTE